MKTNQITLICKKVKFYSRSDENAFFVWIKNMRCIVEFKGVADTIVLCIKNKKIKDEDLRDLVSLFRRYKINMKQLEIFLNKGNQELFDRFKRCSSINVYPYKQE